MLDKKHAKSSLQEVMFDLLYCLKHRFDNYVDENIFLSFQEAASDFYIHGTVSEEKLTECRNLILSLEKVHIDKELLATFLAALTLMGDSCSENKFKKNGYIKYLSSGITYA